MMSATYLLLLMSASMSKSSVEIGNQHKIKVKTLRFASETNLTSAKSLLELVNNNTPRIGNDHLTQRSGQMKNGNGTHTQNSNKDANIESGRPESEVHLLTVDDQAVQKKITSKEIVVETDDSQKRLEDNERGFMNNLDTGPPENEEFTALKQLEAAENYGAVFVSDVNSSERKYLPPHDFFRCGLCLCFARSQDQKVHAACVTVKGIRVLVHTIPEFLPPSTIYLDLMNNPIKRFEINKLAIYKSLKTVQASSNLISALWKSDCQTPVGLQHLNLADNNISAIQDGSFSCMSNLTHLILTKNRITQLTNASLSGLSKLQVLNLAYNNLHNIQAGAFIESPSLSILDLSVNRELGIPRIYYHTFKPLTRLEFLNITGCATNVGVYPTDALLALPALRELAINGEVHPFDQRLSALTNLTKLTLGGRRFCWTKNFTKSYFSGLVHLETLTIQWCKAEEYSPLVFDANPRIMNFELLRQPVGVKNLFPVLCYLQNPDQMRAVSISNARSRSQLIALSASDVKCLTRMKNLVSLSLDQDAISRVMNEFTFGLPSSLKTLSVQGNLLTSSGSVLSQISALSEKFSKFKAMYEDDQGGELLKESYKITAVDYKRDHSTVEYFNLNSHEAKVSLLKSRKPDQIPTDHETQTSSKNLHRNYTHLDIYSATNAIKQGIRLFSLRNPIRVALLNLSGTFINNWGHYPAKRLPPSTIITDLSNNRCKSLRQTFFAPNNSLVELHAGGNFLDVTLSKDDEGSKFSRLTRLEYLDLSKNQLFHLPWLVFQGVPRLRVLKLSWNNVNYVDFHIGHMTSLVYLDLARNSIWAISERTRNALDRLATAGNISLDLTYNPLPCTCEGLDLFRWLSSTRVRLLNKDFLVCVNTAQQQELVRDLSGRFLALQRLCVSKKLLILTSIFSCLILLLVIGFVWIFQKRWWIIYMWNLGVSHFYGYKPSNTSTDREQVTHPGDDSSRPRYTFDAFFVYSPSSLDFVFDEALDQLETRNHRLCLEDRDFLAGSYIPCNITSAVRNSKTTVVVIDENFRSVGWTQYAVQMAQVEAVRSKRNVLHLLLMNSTPGGRLPGVYLKLFRQGHFSELPPRDCLPDVHDKFWDSFSQILGHTNGRGSRRNVRLEVSDVC
ncbi:Toll-like receptor g [Elysia marginata]|uniref:Toll-like receptor g n=1 Tax=Elysia marginata TaxID=1093978 RepID=A0AAV4HX71_9GAST|nr:Toll-like receptor g [Elysia marginata]